MKALLTIIRRDVSLAFRRKGGILHSLMFCLILIALFPLSVGAEPGLLEKIGVGILWVAVLLLSALNMPQMFEEDFEDGSLEAFALFPVKLPLLVAGKIVAHWLVSGVPLALFSPLFAMLLGMGSASWVDLVASLLLGSFLLTLIGACAGALALGIKKAWMLLSLLALPLNIPVLIFGASILGEGGFKAYIGLFALLFILLPVTLTACTLALKAAIEES